MTRTDLVEYVKDYAAAHYNAGWDVVIECFTDAELLEMIGGAQTKLGAVRNVKRRLAL